MVLAFPRIEVNLLDCDCGAVKVFVDVQPIECLIEPSQSQFCLCGLIKMQAFNINEKLIHYFQRYHRSK